MLRGVVFCAQLLLYSQPSLLVGVVCDVGIYQVFSTSYSSVSTFKNFLVSKHAAPRKC